MELPHATEIRTLRAQLERAALARQHLSEVEATLTALSMGTTETAAELVGRLRRDWPDLGLGGDHHAALSAARLALGRTVALGERAGRELHPLVEAQWHELEHDAWAPVRAEIADLLGRRASASASYSPIEGMIATLGPLIGVIEERLRSIVSDLGSSDAVASARGRTLLQSLLEALEPPLAQIGLANAIPRPDVDGSDAHATVLRLAQFRDELEQALTRLHKERIELRRELDAVEASLRARTG